MKLKICFAASTGGHYEQLLLLKPLIEKYDSFLITEKTGYKVSSIADRKTYYLRQVNRREWQFPFSLLINMFRSLWIFINEKPDIVITTGVLSMIPICLLAKLFRKKLIYIESFSKITSPTLTGKLLYKYSDQFYIQWMELLKFYPAAIYRGGIY
jgi:UDP-N-acetylglucosamine:LPS N-acetylglucosamine transferase